MPESDDRLAETAAEPTAAGPRPWARQVVLAAVLGLFGFALVVQVGQDEGETYSSARGVELVELLKSLDATNTRLGTQIEELTATREQLQSATDRSAAAQQQARERSAELSILAGRVGATGPGVRVTITDPDASVDAGLLLDVIQELRDGGAEVMAINGVARVVAQTWFADDADGVRVSGRLIERPFVIEAIGDADTMAAALDLRGGIADRIAARDAKIAVTTVDQLTIAALVDAITPEYAQPGSPDPAP